jgi:nucleolin
MSKAAKKTTNVDDMLSDSDSSVPQTKQTKVASKQAPKKVTKKEESDDSSSDGDVKFLNTKKGREEAKTTKAPAKKQAVESDDSSEEVKPKNGTKKPVGKKVVSSDSESDEPKKPVAKAQAKKAPAKKQESDSDDSDESEEVAPKKTTAQPVKKVPAKKQDSDSDDSDEDVAPKKTTAPVKKAPAKKQDSDEDEESEEVKKPVTKTSQTSNSGCKELFLKNLSWNTDDNKLYEFFGNYGTVENVKVLYDKESGRARGLAFVEFSTRDEAQAAIDDASNLTVDGRTLLATFSDQKDANKGPQQQGPRGGSYGGGSNTSVSNYDGDRHTIFVGNLGFKTTDQSVTNFFKDCGNVVDVRIAKDRDTGKSKGFCHVDFDSANAVEKAKGKAGQQLDGREVRVDASLPRSGGSGGGQRNFIF